MKTTNKEVNMTKPVRHGDVTLHTAKLPAGAKVVAQSTKFVAAEGEVTGHHHTVESDGEFQVLEAGDKRYFVFAKPATISHPEHRTLTIPPGTYRQGQEIEENPFNNEIREVLD